MPDARESTGDLTLGYGEGTYGVLAVKDNGSRVAVGGDLYAGYSGTGDIEVSGGASLAVDGTAYLGHGEGSIGTILVNGVGSELDMSDSLLAVGYDSAGDTQDGLNGGAVTIFGGASATVGELSVGHEAGGGGTVGVTGSGTDGDESTVASRLTVRDDA
ncbi:hypothetical protein LZ189_26005, partial [Rhodovulum sulfidophilum]|nr:hypothetical protein [Rhodovulum sulfidophilum]